MTHHLSEVNLIECMQVNTRLETAAAGEARRRRLQLLLQRIRLNFFQPSDFELHWCPVCSHQQLQGLIEKGKRQLLLSKLPYKSEM